MIPLFLRITFLKLFFIQYVSVNAPYTFLGFLSVVNFKTDVEKSEGPQDGQPKTRGCKEGLSKWSCLVQQRGI